MLLEEAKQVVGMEFRPIDDPGKQDRHTTWLEYLIFACAMEYRYNQLSTKLWGPLPHPAEAWRFLRREKVICQSQENRFNADPEEAYKIMKSEDDRLTALRDVLQARFMAIAASRNNVNIHVEREEAFQQFQQAESELRLATRRRLQVEVFRQCSSNENRLKRQSLRVVWIRSQLDNLRGDGQAAVFPWVPCTAVRSAPALVEVPVSTLGDSSRSWMRIREAGVTRPGLTQPSRQCISDGLWLPHNFMRLHHQLPLESVTDSGGTSTGVDDIIPGGPIIPGLSGLTPESVTTRGGVTTRVYDITHLLSEPQAPGTWEITLEGSNAPGRSAPASPSRESTAGNSTTPATANVTHPTSSRSSVNTANPSASTRGSAANGLVRPAVSAGGAQFPLMPLIFLVSPRLLPLVMMTPLQYRLVTVRRPIPGTG